MPLPDDITETAKLLAELQAKQADVLDNIAPIDAASAALEAQIAEIKRQAEEKMHTIALERRNLEVKIAEQKRHAQTYAQSIEEAQAHLRTLQAAAQAKADELMLEQRWDAITAGAPWREWAKDHQIEAGKRIAYNKKMLLCDTMGTGKTLSAILSLDMIKADTADRSPEWVTERGYFFTTPEGLNIPSDGLQNKDDAYGIPVGEWPKYGEYKILQERPAYGKKVLWYAPAPVMAGAEREIRRWAPHREVIIVGNTSKLERHLTLEMLTKHNLEEYIVIINYEATRRDKKTVQLLAQPGMFDTIVIDEAHNIKNIKTSAYKDVRTVVQGTKAPYVIPMTGTPILNRPQELFALLSLVDEKNFYNINSFLHRYCTQAWVGSGLRWVFQYGGAESLLRKMGHLYLRRTKRECGFLLDEPQVIEYDLDLNEEGYEEQKRVYTSMRDTARIMLDPDLGKSLDAINTLSLYTRLRQLVTCPTGVKITDADGNIIERVEVDQSIKLDTCLSIPKTEDDEIDGLIPQILQESKVVVVSQFNEPLEQLVSRCKSAGINATIYNGDVSIAERDRIKIDFRDKPVGDPQGIDVICLNHSMGEGLDGLQMASNHMIEIDRQWNPGKEDQTIGRLDRMGQEKQVTVHRLRVKNSIDDWLDAIIEEKADLIGGFETSASSMSEQLWNAIKNGEV
jgi:SNF2 family DNA or RNA helicase